MFSQKHTAQRFYAAFITIRLISCPYTNCEKSCFLIECIDDYMLELADNRMKMEDGDCILKATAPCSVLHSTTFVCGSLE